MDLDLDATEPSPKEKPFSFNDLDLGLDMDLSWLDDIDDESKCPSFIFIDEFDAFYHFELSYFIIERLKSYGCQVLLTTHNTSIFTNDLLRPDCYYICSKDKIVNAHNATLKEIRFGHNLEKLYRGGTFGK